MYKGLLGLGILGFGGLYYFNTNHQLVKKFEKEFLEMPDKK
jgi:hypothetical protein